MRVLDIILKFAKCSGQHIEKFWVVDKELVRPPLVICVTTTCLQDRWEQFIFNYKLMELK
jgi:hypothetical protein